MKVALAGTRARRAFRRVVTPAGLDPAGWTPRDLRHSFVSLLCDNGVPLEAIADLCGRAGTTVTEKVYRHRFGRYPSAGHSGRERGPDHQCDPSLYMSGLDVGSPPDVI